MMTKEELERFVAASAAMSNKILYKRELISGRGLNDKIMTIKKFEELSARIIKGDPDAQFKLGEFYRDDPDAQNYNLAVLWFQEAADAGNSNAMLALSSLYFMGIGVEKDVDKSNKLLAKAKSLRGKEEKKNRKKEEEIKIGQTSLIEEATAALTMLGFDANSARKCAERILQDEPQLTVEEILKKALKLL